MRGFAWVVVAACGGTPAPAPIENIAPPARTEEPLAFDATKCEEANLIPIGGGETVSIVSCFEAANNELEREASAYFVRRATPTTGTKIALGRWTQHPEKGEWFEIAAVLRDRSRRVTHVLVRNARGALDAIPHAEVTVYDPHARGFTQRRFSGVAVDVEATDTTAKIVTCNLTPNRTTYDPTKTCAQQAGAQVTTITMP